MIPQERSKRCEQDCHRWQEGLGSRCSREFCVELYREQDAAPQVLNSPIDSSDERAYVSLPILGEVDVDAIYRNPNIRLVEKRRSGPKPRYGVALKKQIVMLDQGSIKTAKSLGRGNISKGVRKAIELARKVRSGILEPA